MKKLFTRELKLTYLTVIEILVSVFIVSIPISFIEYEWLQTVLCIVIPFIEMPFILILIDYNDNKYFNK